MSRPALGPTQPPVQWVPGVLSPGLKRGRGVTLTTHPHLVPRSSMSRSYTSSPPKRLHGVWWDSFSFRVSTRLFVSTSCVLRIKVCVCVLCESRHVAVSDSLEVMWRCHSSAEEDPSAVPSLEIKLFQSTRTTRVTMCQIADSRKASPSLRLTMSHWSLIIFCSFARLSLIHPV
jgi:hypothetical protein